ncbi:hypothetical protein J2795_004428 [Chryseobacterium bernardetii]|uniref:Uncharacterized protein n=2 Tax=Chryseobacterium TaxID=59732 RepID=A0A543DTB0_9FLAO|nr:hypothetical protein [Chryseobacterium vietnamense]MDR6443676.1 hypothetical protein [Chryseobacterium bernardetii]TQM12557.1 hypothetical protein FB551_4675 [Chryseobacterium aquifrigidense]
MLILNFRFLELSIYVYFYLFIDYIVNKFTPNWFDVNFIFNLNVTIVKFFLLTVMKF